MARHIRDSRLSTREARLRLPATREPFWHEVHRGLHIGYRKGQKSGAGHWHLREFREDRRWRRTIGAADDTFDADGATIFSWLQVLKIALGEDRPTIAASVAYTVRQAFSDYWDYRIAKSPARSVVVDQIRAEKVILPKLGARDVNELTPYDLQLWRDRMVKADPDRDVMRRQKATVNRTWSLLRAVLNHAYHNGKAKSDEAWRRVQPFRGVDLPRTRFVTVEEAMRLLAKMPADFRQLARGALYTGLRYGELTALIVSDVADGQVHVRHSKSGRPRSVPLSDDGVAFFKGVIAGKQAKELVFTRSDGASWYPMQTSRYMREACAAAEIDPPVTFHDLRRSYASLLINRGTDAEIIRALLGHADLRMTIRTYAHLLNGTVAAAVKARLPSFGLEEQGAE